MGFPKPFEGISSHTFSLHAGRSMRPATNIARIGGWAIRSGFDGSALSIQKVLLGDPEHVADQPIDDESARKVDEHEREDRRHHIHHNLFLAKT